MKYDEDTYYKMFNDPEMNMDFGSVFMFNFTNDASNAQAVHLAVVEQNVPVVFQRKGSSTTTTTTTTSTTGVNSQVIGVSWLLLLILVLSSPLL